MKILVIFLDTVRGDLSSLKNTELQETELEKFQKKIGGTYYIMLIQLLQILQEHLQQLEVNVS